MGLAKWQTSILGVLWGGETASFTWQGFVGVRRSGSTVSYIRVNYLDDINIGALSLFARFERNGFYPSLSVFYISRLDNRRYREICFARCLVLSDRLENSILKVCSKTVRL